MNVNDLNIIIQETAMKKHYDLIKKAAIDGKTSQRFFVGNAGDVLPEDYPYTLITAGQLAILTDVDNYTFSYPDDETDVVEISGWTL